MAAVAAALALLAAGCGDDDDDGDDDASDVTEAPADDNGDDDEGDGDDSDDGDDVEALEVSLVDFGFAGLPEDIDGGAVQLSLSNDGEVEHEIAFAEIGDTEIEQFFTDFEPVINEGGPVPDYVEGFVGANFVEPGDSTTVTYTLGEGTYAVFCTLTGTPEDPEGEDGAPHYDLGMQQTVTVDDGDDAELPDGDGEITAVDYSFEVDLEGGDTVINLTNDGEQPHFAGIDVYPANTTVEQAEAAFETLMNLEEGQAPPEGTPESEEVAFSGVVTPGLGLQFELPSGLESGRTYLFYCFLSDFEGGPPHAIGNKMFKAFTIE